MPSWARRTLLVTGAGLAMVAGAALAAPPAAVAAPAALPAQISQDVQPASYTHCWSYLASVGYTLTDERLNACANGAFGGWIGDLNCFLGLMNSGIVERHAAEACERADW